MIQFLISYLSLKWAIREILELQGNKTIIVSTQTYEQNDSKPNSVDVKGKTKGKSA